MTTASKILFAVLAVLLAAALVAVGLTISFHSIGVHTFGKAIHYAVFDSAYIVGSDGEKTNLTVWGTYDGKPQSGGCGTFRGAINVDAYPTPYQGDLCLSNDAENGIPFSHRGDYIQAYYLSAGPTVVDGETYISPTGTWYTVVLNPEKPEQIIVIAYDENSTPLGAVVNAGSQEEADRIYDEYIEHIQAL